MAPIERIVNGATVDIILAIPAADNVSDAESLDGVVAVLAVYNIVARCDALSVVFIGAANGDERAAATEKRGVGVGDEGAGLADINNPALAYRKDFNNVYVIHVRVFGIKLPVLGDFLRLFQ